MIQNDIEYIKDEIRQNYKQKYHIIVEGEFDIRYLEKIYDNDRVAIRDLHGKPNVLKFMKEDKDKYGERVIAIVDLDYEVAPESIEYLYHTDTTDLETMIFFLHKKSGSMLGRILQELREEYPHHYKNIFEKVIKQAIKLGYIRYLNERDGLNIAFDFFNTYLNDCVDIDSDGVSIRVDELMKYYAKNTLSLRGESGYDRLVNGVRELEKEEHDWWQICNGHDIILLLHKFMEYNDIFIGSRKLLERKIIERNERQLFKQTKLFKQLPSWASDPNVLS